MQEHHRFPGSNLYHAQEQTWPRERERVNGWGQRVSAEDTRLGCNVACIR
jgi:hypothetical protein